MIKQITISDTTFNVAMASAANQRTVMNVIGKYVMSKALQLAAVGQRVDADFIRGVLLSLPESDLVKIHDLFMDKIVLAGESQAIDIKFFQGKIFTYYGLMAEVICFNLADFFMWLDADLSAENPTE